MHSFAPTPAITELIAKPGWTAVNTVLQVKGYERYPDVDAPGTYDLSGAPYGGLVTTVMSTELKSDWQSLIDAQESVVSSAETQVSNDETALASAHSQYDDAVAALAALPLLDTSDLDAAGLEVDRAENNVAYQNKFGNAATQAAAASRSSDAATAFTSAQADYNADYTERQSAQDNVDGKFGGWQNAAQTLADDQATLASANYYLSLLQANQDSAPESAPEDGSPVTPYVAYNLTALPTGGGVYAFAKYLPSQHLGGSGYHTPDTDGVHTAASVYRWRVTLGAAEIRELRNAGVTALLVTWYEVIRVDYTKEVTDSSTDGGGTVHTYTHRVPDPDHRPTFEVSDVLTEMLSLADGTCLTSVEDGGSLILSGEEHTAAVSAGDQDYRVMSLAGGYYLPLALFDLELMLAVGNRAGWCETTTDGATAASSVGRYLAQTASNDPGAPSGATYSGSKTLSPIPVTVPSTPANLASPRRRATPRTRSRTRFQRVRGPPPSFRAMRSPRTITSRPPPTVLPR